MTAILTLQNRIKSFDGLRALAILLVIFGHAKNTIQSDINLWNIASIFISNSGLGVRLFFVLSGYLITLLILQEVKIKGNLDIKKFYIRRAIRIFPSFYCYLVVVFLLNLAFNWKITVEQFIAATSFTWNYKGIWHNGSLKGNWFLGHLWSLSLEEQFYLLWPLLLIFLSVKNLRKVSATIILILPVVRIATYCLIPSLRGYLGMMLHTAIDSIMVGCFMALISQSPTYSQYIHKLKASYIAILAIWTFFVSPIINYLIRGYSISIGSTIDAVMLGVIIAWLHSHPLASVNKFLSFPIFVYIGKLSYSLYLWQQLFLTNYNSTVLGVFPYNICFSFVAALISYYLIEKPSLNMKSSQKLSILFNLSK